MWKVEELFGKWLKGIYGCKDCQKQQLSQKRGDCWLLTLLISDVYIPWNNTLISTDIDKCLLCTLTYSHYFCKNAVFCSQFEAPQYAALLINIIIVFPSFNSVHVNILMRLFCCIVVSVISDIIILCFQICMMEKLMDHQLDEHNIVKFLGCYQRPSEMVLVFEKLDVNLKKYFDSCFPVPLSEIRSIIQQV